jgi:DNA-binding LacI/PurR family transcriptional regulator
LPATPDTPIRSRSLYYDGLRMEIRNRVLVGQSGERLPGDRELAKEIGTSKITVGHILQELQAEGLVERIPGKGTFLRDRTRAMPATAAPARPVVRPASIARLPQPDAATEPATQAFVMILAVLNVPWEKRPFEDDWSQRLALTAERALQRAGARTMVRSRFGVEEDQIEPLIEAALATGVNRILHISGSLAQPTRSARWDNFAVRLARGIGYAPIPVVQAVFDPAMHLPTAFVSVDGEIGTQMATQHLIDLGHRNIVYVGPSADLPDAQRNWTVDRLRGFRRALQLVGIDPPALLEEPAQVVDTPRLIRGDLAPYGSPEWTHIGRTAAPRIFADPSITAIVAANDAVAAAIIDEAHKAGKSIPGDYSLVGYDNDYLSAGYDLTTVHIPLEQMGEAAANMLLDASATSGMKQQIVFDPTLVIRGSAAKLGV